MGRKHTKRSSATDTSNHHITHTQWFLHNLNADGAIEDVVENGDMDFMWTMMASGQ